MKDHLPKNAQGDYDGRIHNAYALTRYGEAKAELQKISRQLERINLSVAHSLEEGMEETLTIHRLSVGELLRRTLSSTNPIESCLSTIERVTRNVKRWRGGHQALRWTAELQLGRAAKQPIGQSMALSFGEANRVGFQAGAVPGISTEFLRGFLLLAARGALGEFLGGSS